MAVRIEIRSDTSANWASSNPILGAGEPGLETDTGLVRYGDGVTAFTSLPSSDSRIATLVQRSGSQTQTAMDGRYVKAVQVTKLAAFGDSMTAVAQGGYGPFPELVGEYLGLTVYNPSQPGERTSNIAIRQGGLAPRFTVPGGVIPATTATFAVNCEETYTSGFNSAVSGAPQIGVFNNVSFLGIPVNLAYTSTGWTMARVTADSAAAWVPTEGGWARDINSAAWRDAVQVYMGGYNGGNQVTDVTTMSNYLARSGNFIVLSMSTGPSGGNPAPYVSNNNALASAFPNQYFDMVSYVINNGLADEGMTPTAQDSTDIAAGIVPTSLRRSSSDPHYNAIGHRVIARKLAELLIARGFVSSNNAQHIPPRAKKTSLSLPNTNSYASLFQPQGIETAENISIQVINLAVPSPTSASAYRNIISMLTGDGKTLYWQFLLDSNGYLFFQDANGNGGASTAVPTASGKTSVRLDINRTGGTAALYTSIDGGATWQAYGTAFSGRSTTNPIVGANMNMMVGFNGSYNAITGATVDRVQVLDGSGNPLYVQYFTDASDAPDWTLTNGAVLA